MSTKTPFPPAIEQISRIPGCSGKKCEFDAETRKAILQSRSDRTRCSTAPLIIPPVVCRRWRPEAWKGIPTSPHIMHSSYRAPLSLEASRTWNNFKVIDSSKMILRGTYSLWSRRYGLMSCGKQSAAIAIVTLGFKKVFPVSKWISSDMDRILDEGTKLYKRTIIHSRIKRGSILKPNEVFCNFYIDSSKIIANAGKDVFENVFENDQLQPDLDNFLKLYKSCIFYAADKCFALWKTSDNSFYILNAYDTDENGNMVPITKGGCCCLRLLSMPLVIDYLNSIFKLNYGKYELYSVDILKIEKLLDSAKTFEGMDAVLPTDDQLLSRKESRLYTRPITVPMINEARLPMFTFSDDFDKINENKGILRATRFIDETMKVPAVNLAALIMLRNYRTLTWDTDKIDEILEIGLQLYDKSVENSNVVSFGEQKYSIDSTQIVIGEIVSSKANICDLITGLRQFFKLYDTGLVQGPQNIGIWQEAGYYFLFDPKERNKFGEKFVKNPELTGNEEFGKACLLWFTKLNDLVDCYIKNVPHKYRFDPYRLTKIEIEEVRTKSDDWYDWCSFDFNKWIIRGQFSQNNKRYCEENRNKQSTCIAAMALVFEKIQPLSGWNSKILENIMDIGDGLYTKSLKALRDAEKFTDFQLNCKEIIEVFTFESYRMEFKIDDCVVNGILGKAEPVKSEDEKPEKVVTLLDGLREFFNVYDKAILTGCGVSLAIWRSGEYYYCFDSHPRDCEGKNSVTCSNATGCFGTCCALRFFSLTQLADHVEGNMEFTELSAPFNLSRIEFILIEEKLRPELNYYQSLGEQSAILRPIERGLHEGNRSLFDIRSNRQTLCNLVVSLALANISRSMKWSAQYINDILCIGDKMFCRIIKQLGSDIDDNFVLTWNELDKEIQIGLNQFTFDFQIMRKGIIEEEPSILSVQSSSSSKGSSGLSAGTEQDLDADPDNDPSQNPPDNLPVKTATGDVEVKPKVSKPKDVVQKSVNKTASDEPMVKPDDAPLPADPAPASSASPVQQIAVEAAIPIDLVETASARGSQRSNRSRLDRLSSSHSKPSSEVERKRIIAKLKAHDISGLSNVSHIYNLRSIFAEWESIITLYAILQTEALLCAVWKQDNLYFIFDPKGTDDEIKFLPERIEEVRRKISEKYENENKSKTDLKSQSGSLTVKDDSRAYAAWFTTPEDLIDHILSVIPEEFAYRIFTLYKLDFQTTLIDQPNQEERTILNFTFIDEDVSVMRGSMSQNYKIFAKYPNRNNQDATNCATAIAFSLFCDSIDWKTTLLDVVLKYGDRLYTQSFKFMKNLDPSMNFFKDPKLKLHHLATPFLITNMKFYVTTNALECDTKDIDNQLGSLLQEHHSLVLECRNYYVALWIEKGTNSAGGDAGNNAFYMFDSHDIGPNGLKRINGAAALYRSENIPALVSYFCRNCDADRTKDDIKVYRVQIIMKLLPGRVKLCIDNEIYDHDEFDVQDDNLDYETSDHLPANYSSFKQHDLYSKVLTGTMLPDRLMVQCTMSCYILAAIITCQVIAPDYWTEITMDEILKLGDRLYREQPINDLNDEVKILQHFSKLDILIDKVELTDEILDENIAIIMEHFFEDHIIGVFLLMDVIFAVWKNTARFYIYTPPTKTGMPHLYKTYSVKCFGKLLLELSAGAATFTLKKCDIIFKIKK